jgi:pyrroline-5-carboxylate reductase
MEISDLKIAIIGAGNMGGAMAKGFSRGNLVQSKNIRLSDINTSNLENIKSVAPGIITSKSNKEIIDGADLIILAVKPWLIEQVSSEICNLINYQNQIIVSVAAGVDLSQLHQFFNPEAMIFRIIPNTAIEISQSVSTVSGSYVSEDQKLMISRLFGELGKVFIVPESQLNAMMSLSSCGIAYAFRYIRAAMEGGIEMGIYPQTAKEVVLQTLRGAVELIEANNSHPEVEIDKVTTPGGITIRGLNEMEANGFTSSVIKGLKASKIS